MKLVLSLGCLLFAACLSGCQSHAPGEKVTTYENAPLYGTLTGLKRGNHEKEDLKFIEDVTKQFGSREAAANVWVDYGFRNYREKNYSVAMKRFNQAWLLNPRNPEVYWGFASVCAERKQTKSALLLMERAFIFGLRKPGFLADSGAMFARAATDVDLPEYRKQTAAEKADRLKRADELFALAVATAPANGYVAEKRLTAYIAAERYPEAWQEVERGRQAGVQFPPPLIQYLREQTPRGK